MDGDKNSGCGPLPHDILAGTGDAALAVDREGRITGWNTAAERLFGLPGVDVLGRRCSAVLGCQDLHGRTLGPSSCPVMQSIRAQKPPVGLDILVRHRSGYTIGASESAVLLHSDAMASSAALLVIRPSPAGVVEISAGYGPSSHGQATSQEEHWLGTRLDLTSTLDRVLIATDADAAELFLTSPTNGKLVLVAHRGKAPRSFRQITQFDYGEGFPGLVAQTGEPLVSLDLPHDDRYLRTLVKHHGFRSYVCVPVWSDSSFLGSLHIALRRRARTLVPQLSFLVQVARELGRALELARLRAAEPVASLVLDPGTHASASLRVAARQALRTLIEVAVAECGLLSLVDESSRTFEPVSEWGLGSRLRKSLQRACRAERCPAVTQRRCVVVSSSSQESSSPCRPKRRDLATTICLPLEIDHHVLGVALLGYYHREPLPTRHLSYLHHLVKVAAARIHNAQVALRHEDRAQPVAAAGPLNDSDGLATNTQAVESARPTPLGRKAPFLDIRCLGPFMVLRDGRLVPWEQFGRRRSLTLLKILLTRYGRQVHREELMELLWPEADPRSANALLNVVVHYLRRGLEPNAPDSQPSSFIRRKGDYYYFDPQSPHRLDSHEFLRAADLGARLESEGRGAEAVDAYQRAIALYAGDFLEEDLYNDWCALEREYLRERFLTVLRRAGHLHLDRGHMDAAIACFRRALHCDGTLEDVHRALMEALWRAGRRDEALRQYRECRSTLERELGITPMPETEALYRQIAERWTPAENVG